MFVEVGPNVGWWSDGEKPKMILYSRNIDTESADFVDAS